MEHALPHFTPGGLGFALGLTLMAGLATGLGSALAFFAKRTNLRLLAWALAFSAGVMLYVSFMEIMPKATGSRGRAFAYSFLSGLAEPLGGLFAAVKLDWLLPPHVVGLVFAGVAGVMVYVSLDELLPTARQYGRSHEVLAAIAGGMAVMAVSLLLLR